jgi:tetratricopeptide (TPR) repeat protein
MRSWKVNRFKAAGVLANDTIKILSYKITLYPNSPNTYDSLAEAYLTKGDKENAVKYYKLAIEKNPGNSACEKRLLQSSQGKLKELGVIK